MGEVLALVCIIVVVFFLALIVVLSRYRKCPSDKILVIYGMVGKDKTGNDRSATCVHGGASFVWPVVQSYQYLDLTPISISVDLRNALSRQNIRIDVPSRFTVGISTEQAIMQNAAERLLGLKLQEVQELAKDIILGQLRLIIATMDIEEINSDRDKFLEAVSRNVEGELKKIGLRLINVNITDINDESGYIEALGKEAAAKAINDAKRSVAEKDRDGAIGEANARRDQRIQVAEANALAIAGENDSKANIAQSDAERREREAQAMRIATAAEQVQEAKANLEAYEAQKMAELQRAELQRATQEADIVVQAETLKKKMEIDAEALAEQTRRRAKGEADGTYERMAAEARGVEAILTKQALGLAQIVAAAGGNSEAAIRLMIANRLEELTRIQVDAIKNLKIDKVTVWDGMSDGKTPATANFLSGMLKAVPPMSDMFEMAGMKLPDYLGKPAEAPETKAEG